LSDEDSLSHYPSVFKSAAKAHSKRWRGFGPCEFQAVLRLAKPALRLN
jgi:hypothetical protein